MRQPEGCHGPASLAEGREWPNISGAKICEAMEVEMAAKTGFMQAMVNALIDGRQRSAQRYVESYLREHRIAPPQTEKR